MGISVVSSIYNAPSIYETGAGGGGGGGSPIPLPTGYKSIEKLELRGRGDGVVIPMSDFRANYANTSTRLIIRAKLNVFQVNYNSSIVKSLPKLPGYNTNWNNYYFVYNTVINGSAGFYNVFTGMTENLKDLMKDEFTFKMDRQKIELEDLSQSFSADEITKSDFIVGDGDPYYGSIMDADIFSFQMENTADEKIFIGVPSMREADEKTGLFDLITGEFFPKVV